MATVLLFGAFQDLAGWDARVIDAPTLGALKAILVPALGDHLDRAGTLTILNHALLPRGGNHDSQALVSNDEVAFGPPVSGG